jgi:GT2 family glycosyltransferase/glycosyltransferase involved in cell wall biosynthesis
VSEIDKKSEETDAPPAATVSDLQRAELLIKRLTRELDLYRAEFAQLERRYKTMETSFSWRIFEPVRQVAARYPSIATIVRRFAKLVYWTLTGQLVSRLRAAWRASKARSAHSPIKERRARLNSKIREAVAMAKVAKTATPGGDAPTISIILPTYKSPLDSLNDAILSVRAQTYSAWELCICDDGSADEKLAALIESHVSGDARIRLCSLPTNKGISAASNTALAMSRGEYVGFLDHDDLLLPEALMQFAQRLAFDDTIDMAYSDEAIIDATGEPVLIFTKPDWSPVLLFAMMYVGHLTLYRRSLVDAVGGFRPAYDFSQDFDLALRIAERIRKVDHIGEVLYCWRAIEGSAASGGKSYARTTNIAATTDALRRRGLPARGIAQAQSNQVMFDPGTLLDRVSLIIPSDDKANLLAPFLSSITGLSTYKNFEIIVVMNSDRIAEFNANDRWPGVRFERYDRPFNFSDKCNAGARAASGDVLIFLNDDMLVIEPQWIERLLECLKLPGVGAASPKLLYRDGTIQHAGMVVGVRNLVGTAFHCLPELTGDHFNLAQCMRESTVLSGACLAIKASIFRELGGFDAVNVPNAHSDVDLCLRVWAAGYSCIYTPHAKLSHFGHLSIGAGYPPAPRLCSKDKANIYLLRRWCKEISYDPFYPPGIRDQIYRDFPDDYQIFPQLSSAPAIGGRDFLIISHDLSASGAPMIAHQVAALLKKHGHFVVVTAPRDGYYRHVFQALGVPVIVDAALLKGEEPVLNFAKNFDAVIANTVVTWPAVRQLANFVDVYWYLHESEMVKELVQAEPELRVAISGAKDVWVGSARGARYTRPYRSDIFSLEYGFDDWPLATADDTTTGGLTADKPAIVSMFGSFEGRKGQDLAVSCVRELPPEIAAKCELRLFGRILDAEYHAKVLDLVRDAPNIVVGGPLTPDQYLGELQKSDIVLVPSRDDTLPLVSIDALRAGKVLICTPAVGTVDYLASPNCAFIANSATVGDLGDAIIAAINRRDEWPLIGREAKKVFERHFTMRTFERRLLERLELTAQAEPSAGLVPFADAR